MEWSRHVRLLPTDGYEELDDVSMVATMRSPTYHRLASPLRRGISRTRQWLLNDQQSDGYWVGELEGDTILESEYILLLAWLGRQDDDVAHRAAEHIVQQQLPGGGWAIYPGGQVEISASVKAYFALKLTGHNPGADYMQRARAAILAHGGADAVNSFTRFYLALLGQISYAQCPAVPPEMMLLPKWLPVNLYSVSSWSRTIIVPLSIMSAYQPVCSIDPRFGIRELFLRNPQDWPALRCPGLKGGTGIFSWDRFFRTVDRGLKWCQRHKFLPLRNRAIRAAERWILDRFEGSDGLGAIFPPMIWSVIALKCLGYADDSPELKYCHERLEGLFLEDEQSGALRLQPCKSPVWDTAIALRALADSGVQPEHGAVDRAVQWLLSQEVRRRGDWAETVHVAPGGWCFEFANEFYPDLDDTAMVVMALANQFSPMPVDALPPELQLVDEQLSQFGSTEESEPRDRSAVLGRTTGAIERAENWMLAMQNGDGGWGAFDRDNDREFLCYVPFADHNAMIDPSTPDLTARVLEALGQLGRRVGDPAVDRAVKYLRQTQEADGSWFGRWGVNYVYGTWQVLTGLRAIGVSTSDPMMTAGANWLLAYQQSSGGWGESPDSYTDPRLRGQGPVTASQTAWAVLGLLAAGMHHHPATARGIHYLLDAQNEDGSWDEPEFTGTGFPRVFYLRYHLYRIYFPLIALSRYTVAIGADDWEEPETSSLQIANISLQN